MVSSEVVLRELYFRQKDILMYHCDLHYKTINNSMQLLIQTEIFDYAYIFINDKIIPSPNKLSHLKKFIEEACQLLDEIRDFEEPPPLRVETIIKGLICCQKERLILNSSLTSSLNLLIEKLFDHYYAIASR